MRLQRMLVCIRWVLSNYPGKDFDFGHSAPAAAPAKSDRNASAFAASLDDFWDTPALTRAPAKSTPSGAAPTSLKDVEAELAAQRTGSAPKAPEASRPLTLGEVEAQLLAQRRMATASPAVPRPPMMPGMGMPSPSVPPTGGMPQRPPGLASMPTPGPPPGMPAGARPPMPMPSGIPPAAAPRPASGPMARPAAPPAAPTVAPIPSPASVPTPSGPAAPPTPQAEHLARMRAMLEACPSSVQQTILSLPPPIQFDSLEDVVRQFPSLVRGETNDVDAAVQMLTSQAAARLQAWQKAEDKRRAKAAKLAHIARYNGVMSGSDKDFITRIQISHLVTPDPYTDDFYAHVFFAVRGGARKVPVPDGSVEAIEQHKKAEAGGSSGGKGSRRKLTRHENAMLRMQQQVERLVDNRKKREAKGADASLEGALGRVSLGSATKPRQMLQLINKPEEATAAVPDATNHEDAMRLALQGASLGDVAREPQNATQKALTRRESMVILEHLYSMVLRLEQLRREPSDDDSEAQVLTEKLWKELRVLEPLGVSDPHPFVSLLNHVKGKRMLPRVLRLLDTEQALTMLTMLIASFQSLDAVRDYAAWEQFQVTETLRHVRTTLMPSQAAEVGRNIDAFSNSVLFIMMSLVSSMSLRIVCGMLALLMERNDVLVCAKTRPGVSLLTALLSRAESLKQAASQPGTTDAPTPDELSQWSSVFGVLFNRLSADHQLAQLFFSSRVQTYLPFGVDMYMAGRRTGSSAPDANVEDEPVWNLMALFAIHADLAQQQVLVQELREKILSNVMAAKEAKSTGSTAPGDEDVRIRNVNLLVRILSYETHHLAPCAQSRCRSNYIVIHCIDKRGGIIVSDSRYTSNESMLHVTTRA